MYRVRCKTILLLAVSVAIGALFASHDGFSGGFRQPAVFAEVNIGDIWITEEFTVRVPVANSGSEAITLTRLQTSCSCASPVTKSLLIPPGGDEVIEVNLKAPTPDHNREEFTDLSFLVMADAKSFGEVQSWQWKVNVRMRRAVTVQPPWLSLVNEQLVAGQGDFEWTLSLRSTVPLQEVLCGFADRSDLWTAHIDQSLGDSRSYTVHLAVSAGEANAGKESSDLLQLTAILKDGTRLPPISVPIRVVPASEICVMPSAVRQGLKPVGTYAKASVHLWSRHNRPFEVVDLRFDSDCVRVEHDPFWCTREPGRSGT